MRLQLKLMRVRILTNARDEKSGLKMVQIVRETGKFDYMEELNEQSGKEEER